MSIDGGNTIKEEFSAAGRFGDIVNGGGTGG